ncbi:MAG: hypothetical protein ACRDLA_15600, partial [Thermoleophilaceae bacterium]
MSEASGEILERLPSERWSEIEATGMRRYLALIRQWLPKGQFLPEHIWRRRHATIVWLLWAHVPFLVTFGLFMGQSPLHMLQEGSIVAIAAWIAHSERYGMKTRVVAASFGLISCSAILVHLSGGYIEA